MTRVMTTSLARSDDPDQIENCVASIGKSAQRLSVFEAIYYGQRQKKTVKMLMDTTELSERQVRAAVVYLCDHHMCHVEGRGEETQIYKDEFCRKYRDKIVRAARNPAYRENLPTKRPKKTSGNRSVVAALPMRAPRVRRARKQSKNELTVAFLTTNPDKDLRTDAEYRAVLTRWRESEYRDRIALENVAAASIEDLLMTFNNMKPDIVHFSGHGNAGLVVFDSDLLYGDAVEVEFDVLKMALESTNNPPRLVVLNSCYGALRASELLGEVEAVVGMNSSIDDAAAAIFARQFYASLFSGQSADKAMKQGKVVLSAMGLADADFPELIATESADVARMSFIS